jgi:hypothetical protein
MSNILVSELVVWRDAPVLAIQVSTSIKLVCELVRGPTKAHMKSLYRFIKYVVDTKNCGLVMEPKQPAENNVWEMMAYCDSNYAGDKDGRKSVT